MRIKIPFTTTLIALVVAGSAFAADIIMPTPLPGPYQQIKMPTSAAPTPTPNGSAQMPQFQQTQPYWMQAPRQQMPYWMQAPQAPTRTPAPANQNTPTQNVQARGQAQGGFGFNAQAQAQTRNTFRQGYGTSTPPGFFPGYAATAPSTSNNPNTQPNGYAAPQAAPSYQNYPAPNFPNQPVWNGPWGAPNFGQWGQTYPNGYGVPFWWQQ